MSTKHFTTALGGILEQNQTSLNDEWVNVIVDTWGRTRTSIEAVVGSAPSSNSFCGRYSC